LLQGREIVMVTMTMTMTMTMVMMTMMMMMRRMMIIRLEGVPAWLGRRTLAGTADRTVDPPPHSVV
jgi:hypothetical protein